MRPLKVGETLDRRVGEFTYRLSAVPFGRSRDGLVRLANVLGGAMRRGAGGVVTAEGAARGQASLENLDGPVGALFEKLSVDDLDYFERLFREVTLLRVGEPGEDRWIPLTQDVAFNDHFTGRPLQYFRWLAAAGEVTYADFSDAVGTVGRALAAVLAERAAEVFESNSPTASTSTSTASSPPVDTPPSPTPAS